MARSDESCSARCAKRVRSKHTACTACTTCTACTARAPGVELHQKVDTLGPHLRNLPAQPARQPRQRRVGRRHGASVDQLGHELGLQSREGREKGGREGGGGGQRSEDRQAVLNTQLQIPTHHPSPATAPKAAHLAQVQPAVEEGAKGELSGGRQARAGLEAALQHALRGDAAAVGVNLNHVLRGVAARLQHGQQQHLVERAAPRVDDGAVVDAVALRLPGRPRLLPGLLLLLLLLILPLLRCRRLHCSPRAAGGAEDGLRDGHGVQAREADDGDRALLRPRHDGCNRVVVATAAAAARLLVGAPACRLLREACEAQELCQDGEGRRWSEQAAAAGGGVFPTCSHCWPACSPCSRLARQRHERPLPVRKRLGGGCRSGVAPAACLGAAWHTAWRVPVVVSTAGMALAAASGRGGRTVAERLLRWLQAAPARS